MKLFAFICCLFLAPFMMVAQEYFHDAQKCEITNVNIALNEATTDDLVKSKLTAFLSLKKPFDLVSVSEKYSPKNTYFTYQISYQNSPLFNQLVKVIVNPKHQIIQVISNLDEAYLDEDLFQKNAGLFPYKNQLDESVLACDTQYFFAENKWQLVSVLKIKKHDDVSDYFINQNGEILFVKSNVLEVKEPVRLWVYNPDPLTTSHAVYAGQFMNNNGADSDSLTGARVLKSLLLENQNDTFYLQSDSLFIGDVSGPNYPATFTTINDTFNFTRSQNQFGDVNAFYHATDMKQLVKNYGFGLPDIILKIDAHAFNGADRSAFNYGNSPPTLEFGDGGIPDAEDADVIRHEFSHSMSFSASPNTDIGLERLSIEEGLADYFAASYSRSVDVFGSNKVFNWDGNETWNGRTVNFSMYYPQNGLVSGTRWNNGQLWSTAMMRVWDSCGKEVTDVLMLEALYSLMSNMRMPQLANQIIAADTLWFGGIHTNQIKCAFFQNEILLPDSNNNICSPKKPIETYKLQFQNTEAFARNAGNIKIVSTEALLNVEIYDALGRNITRVTSGNNPHEINIPRELISVSGIYFLVLTTEKNQQISHKIMRY